MTADYTRFDCGRGLNYWTHDPVLQYEVDRTYPDADRDWAVPRLDSFGTLIGETVAANANVIDDHGPELETYDRDGEVVNAVTYHPAQLENERAVYEFGTVADSFRAPPDRDERLPLVYHLTLDYLLSYADIGLTCPVAMTAGAALVLEQFDDGDNTHYLEGLLARDYDQLLQGAMFLTEQQGGSDLGVTQTVAEHEEEDAYRLTGEKWFCSNIDAEVILTLARRPGAREGTEGLSLFLVPRTTRDGEPNSMLARRLKDKLGTVSVPTGEVEFDDTEAYLIGEPERGFRYMAEMLNLERLANAFGACGAMGRALLESRIKAANRETFGKRLHEHPLMRRDLVELTVAHEAATAFTFDAGVAYNTAVRESNDDAFRLMRALVPVAKHRTGRLAVDIASYAMEIQGGNGYVAEWVTHRLLRDTQVLPIWEGTSNVLSLDLLRAMAREGSHVAVMDRIEDYLEAADHPVLADLRETVQVSADDLDSAFETLAAEGEDYAQLNAKAVANLLYDVYAAALLLAEAQTDLEAGDGRKVLVARRFVVDRLRQQQARGITNGDRLADEWFEAIVQFESVEPADLESSVAAAD